MGWRFGPRTGGRDSLLLTHAERRLLAGLVIVLATGYGLEALRAARIGPYRDAASSDPLGGLDDDPGDLAPYNDAVSTVLQAQGDAQMTPQGEILRETEDWPFRDGFLDLNRADSTDLVALPGIGPALAGRILALRRGRGSFTSVDELLEVKGIGQKRLAQLGQFVSVGDRCSLQPNPLRFSDCIPAELFDESHVNPVRSDSVLHIK